MPRSVTVFGRVNHLGAESGPLSLSLPSVVRLDLYAAKTGEVNRHIV